jgi:hypothetical protein
MNGYLWLKGESVKVQLHFPPPLPLDFFSELKSSAERQGTISISPAFTDTAYRVIALDVCGEEKETSIFLLSMEFVLPRAITLSDVAKTGFSHQPQWDSRAVFFRYQHTQSVWGPLPTAKQDSLAAEHLCATCKEVKSTCLCNHCYLCKTQVGFGTRHHCRKCWKTTCKACRLRKRYLNPMIENSVAELTCDKCAVYEGLSSLTTANDRLCGVHLLIECAEMPRRCIGSGCATVTYSRTCTSCCLPTVPTAPYVERLVRVEYCCRWSKCSKCASLEKRTKDLDSVARVTSEQQFLASEQAYSAEARLLGLQIGSKLNVDPSSAVAQNPENLLLAVVCASVCYEYGSYPGLSLTLSDIPHSKFLVLRGCSQLFSIFQGPNKTIFIALPGTHDLRTVLTDAQFTRVVETQMSEHNGGYAVCGRNLNAGVATLWEYKVHSGFLTEEMKLRCELSTASLKLYIEEGFNIIFCGHSLGGSLAVLSTLRLLSDDLATFQDRIACVAIGAPFVGNSALTRKVQRCGWERYFHHLVYRADIVPRLLCARSIPKEIVQQLQDHVTTTVQSVQSAVQNFFNRPRSGSMPSGAGLEAEAYEVDRAGSEPLGACEEITMNALLFGDKRPFDTFGHFYFLFRENSVVSRSTNPRDSFGLLRKKLSGSTQLNDHLIDSYNRAVAQLLRQ